MSYPPVYFLSVFQLKIKILKGSEISEGIKRRKMEIGMPKLLEKRIYQAGVRILRNKKRFKRIH